MWLPTPVYERIPQFWLLVGLLFMAGGLYLGFDYKLSSWYFGIGIVCVLWSIAMFMKRSGYRLRLVRESMTIVEDGQEGSEQQEQQEQAPPQSE